MVTTALLPLALDILAARDLKDAALSAILHAEIAPNGTGTAHLRLPHTLAGALGEALVHALPLDVRARLLAASPEAGALLRTLAAHLGYGVVPPAPLADHDAGPQDCPSAERYRRCLTPVGPGHACRHPGSHHAATGPCTHIGCPCPGFRPAPAPEPDTSAETVLEYLQRLATSQGLVWHEEDARQALKASHIPYKTRDYVDILASDWRPLLGKVLVQLGTPAPQEGQAAMP